MNNPKWNKELIIKHIRIILTNVNIHFYHLMLKEKKPISVKMLWIFDEKNKLKKFGDISNLIIQWKRKKMQIYFWKSFHEIINTESTVATNWTNYYELDETTYTKKASKKPSFRACLALRAKHKWRGIPNSIF